MNNDHLQLHEHGELSGLGPSWACARYATAGHDYYTCPDCLNNYQAWLNMVYVGSAVEA